MGSELGRARGSSNMIPLPTGPFACILADPPWGFRTWSVKQAVPHRGIHDHYCVMTTGGHCAPAGDSACSRELSARHAGYRQPSPGRAARRRGPGLQIQESRFCMGQGQNWHGLPDSPAGRNLSAVYARQARVAGQGYSATHQRATSRALAQAGRNPRTSHATCCRAISGAVCP